VLQHLSFLHKYIPNFERHLEQFREYKQAVPTFGAILLNEELTHVNQLNISISIVHYDKDFKKNVSTGLTGSRILVQELMGIS
jgi:hypothetical protein